MWKIVKCLAQLKSETKTLTTELKIGDEGLLSNQVAIWNKINQFFANIGKNLSKLIPRVTEHFTINIKVTIKNSFFFTPTTTKEVTTVIL